MPLYHSYKLGLSCEGAFISHLRLNFNEVVGLTALLPLLNQLCKKLC